MSSSVWNLQLSANTNYNDTSHGILTCVATYIMKCINGYIHIAISFQFPLISIYINIYIFMYIDINGNWNEIGVRYFND